VPSTDDELHAFLTQLPVWARRELMYYPMSAEDLLQSATSDLKTAELRGRFEEILRCNRQLWNEYCRRVQRQNQSVGALWKVFQYRPKGIPGRSRKDGLAKEAHSLQHRGLSNPQIAAQLNNAHGAGTTTTEAVRKLLDRHPDPDKI
jgi:hypothetical protein